ncbi:hypothetical protein ANN_14890 [Periplaneta americana]|uniref:Uncharacterized protein n=1 Tax=Periplaneta americana TaxID=6978 RepID=A0ABQ8SYS0_PERAM|nr:hypothetical protein ANN_14890 [Periplaneta americana]
MEQLEQVKARYLNRALGLPQKARSRLVYKPTRQTFLIEDLRREIMLPANNAYKQLLQENQHTGGILHNMCDAR